MSAVASCPAKEKLSEYLLGVLEEHDAREVEEHLSDCRSCEDTICQLDEVTDTVLESLRAEDTDSAQQEEWAGPIAAAMRSAREIRPLGDTAAPVAAAGSVELGGTLGQYQIMEQIGRVYRAEHTKLERPVAIKIVPGGQVQHPEIIARFDREMRAIGKLDHGNLVRAFDAGETENNEYLYLVMELVEGMDVGQLLASRRKLPVNEACEIVRQTCEGLNYIHSQGQIHRDIKPSNLMVTPEGTVKILDLGLALLADVEHDKLTTAGQLMGTFDYMSPEQASSSHQVTEAADVYSLGCTLYALLTGSPPFASGAYAGPAQKIVAHSTVEPKPVAEHRSELPGSLAELVGRMLAKRAEDRPSLDEVIEVLENVGSQTSNDEPTLIAPRPAAAEAGIRGRRTGAMWGIAAVLLIGLGLLGSGGLYQIIVTIKNEKGEEQRMELKDGDPPVVISNEGGIPEVKRYAARTADLGEPTAWPGGLVQYPAEIEGIEWNVTTAAHRGFINWAEFSPDGSHLATFGYDQVLRVWDTQTGKLARVFLGGQNRYSSRPIAWSADGSMLALAAGDLSVWELKTGNRVLFRKGFNAINLDWAPEGPRLAVSNSRQSFVVWDVEKGKVWDEFQTAASSQHAHRIHWSTDGKRIAALIDQENRLEIWNLAQRRQETTLDIGEIVPGEVRHYIRIEWSPESDKLVVGLTTGILQVHDLGDESSVNYEVDSFPLLAWTADGKEIIYGRGKIDPATGEKQVLNEIGHSQGKTRRGFIAISRDGKQLAAIDRGQHDDALALWSVATGEQVHRLQAALPSYIAGMGWTSDHEFVGFNRNWDVRRGKAFGGTTWERSKLFRIRSYPSYSPDGKLYAVLDGESVLIKTAGNDKIVATLEKVGEAVQTPQWSRDGKRLLTSSQDATIVWEIPSGKQVVEMNRFWRQPRMSLDGKRIFDGTNVFLVDENRKERQIQLPFHIYSPWVQRTADPSVMYVRESEWAKVNIVSGEILDHGSDRMRKHGQDLASPGAAFLAHFQLGNVLFFDLDDDRFLGSIANLPGGNFVAVSPEGHLAGRTLRYADEVVYVVRQGNLHHTFAQQAFEDSFGWKNDPQQVYFRP